MEYDFDAAAAKLRFYNLSGVLSNELRKILKKELSYDDLLSELRQFKNQLETLRDCGIDTVIGEVDLIIIDVMNRKTQEMISRW